VRWECTCAYDGTGFFGWQSQSNHLAVQDILEDQLQFIFKKFIRIHGSSRTDAGVHAKGQVFHFDADWLHGPERLRMAINSRLEHNVRILKVEPVDDQFHARFSVKKKTYRYHFQLTPANPFEYPYVWDFPAKNFNLKRLEEALPLFVGQHDFRGFSGKVLPEENSVKTLFSAKLFFENNHWIFETVGSGYLYRMVRMLMGSLVMCGYGKISPDFIEKRLQLQNLSYPIVTAPARGLFLEKVEY